jgi:hypothetical protein
MMSEGHRIIETVNVRAEGSSAGEVAPELHIARALTLTLSRKRARAIVCRSVAPCEHRPRAGLVLATGDDARHARATSHVMPRAFHVMLQLVWLR